MLPITLSRDVHGISSRRLAPEMQMEKLVGRSRAERMLDKFYNRQSRLIRLIQSKSTSQEVKKIEVKKKEIKEESVGEQTSVITRDIDPVSIIDRLIKSSSVPGKFEKVFNLAYQLVDSRFFETNLMHFIDLYTAISCSPSVYSTPKQRSQIMNFMKCLQTSVKKPTSTNSQSISSEAPFKKPRSVPKFLNYEEKPEQLKMSEINKDEHVSLQNWVDILSINIYWHNMLFTDDSFKFNQVLRYIEQCIKQLPYPDYKEKPKLDVYLYLQNHRTTSVNQNNNKQNACAVDNLRKPEQYQAYLPLRWIAYEYQRDVLINILKSAQAYASIQWSRAAVIQFFNEIYYNKEKYFYECDYVCLEALQKTIVNKDISNDKAKLVNPLAAGEHYHPVRDGRDEKIIAVHGASVWSAKQFGLH